MIFLSYTAADNHLVEPVANKLAEIFGMDNIFFDRWSIQPGDGIIDKMNLGLKSCKLFFFFVSKKSLQSTMVNIEWQNALYKRSQDELKFIPVRLEDVMMPAVLLQNLYIDFFTQGPEVALRQMIDVINGKNTYNQTHSGYKNIRAYVTVHPDLKTIIEFRAECYMEPHSNYMILVENEKDEITFSAIGESSFNSGFNRVKLDNGVEANAICIGRDSATSPQYPFIVEIKHKNGLEIKLKLVMKSVSSEKFEAIPIIIQQT